MPPRNLVRAFLGLYVVTGVVVLLQSVQTVLAARAGYIRPPDQIHAIILGSFEAVAALLFLVPTTMRWGAAGLLSIFLAAIALHAGHGSFPSTLLVYGAAVLFVRVHGVQTSYFHALRG